MKGDGDLHVCSSSVHNLRIYDRPNSVRVDVFMF